MYMCGPKVKKPVYPAPLLLYGKELPWVPHASHLGHEIHQDCTMDMDTRMKRAAFIRNSSDIRNMFSFAMPSEVLRAITIYSTHFYGAMIWDLYGEVACQVYRSWNTCVKLVWGLPRSTHNYFVDNLLSGGFPSVRKKILSQYISFLLRLRKSVSPETRLMSGISAADVRSPTGKNCHNIAVEFQFNPWSSSPSLLKSSYSYYQVPHSDIWRLSLLTNLLDQRYEISACGEETETVDGLIDSLCSS